MIPYEFQGNFSRMKTDAKSGWQKGTIGDDDPRHFCHGANKLTPDRAEQWGISPMHAQDVAIDASDRLIGSGKFVYTFPAQKLGAIYKPLTKHKALWASAYYFVFEVPVGTEYWCTGGRIAGTAEVAFPYIVEPEDIRWVYDKSYSPVAFSAKPSLTAAW